MPSREVNRPERVPSWAETGCPKIKETVEGRQPDVDSVDAGHSHYLCRRPRSPGFKWPGLDAACDTERGGHDSIETNASRCVVGEGRESDIRHFTRGSWDKEFRVASCKG